MESNYLQSEQDTLAWAKSIAGQFVAGDVILLSGTLGAGKTTWVRGFLSGLEWEGAVRSPTYNLLQTFDTRPPVLHADLYRVKSAFGIGLEDYLDTHICLIEWPDRLGNSIDSSTCWWLEIEFEGEGRRVTLTSPSDHPQSPG